jgi:rSAM/selenodomain-associated transferase 1
MAKKKSNDKSLLIIFYRNPEMGKVKTRLAASIGDSKAYSIYLLLSEHTRIVTEVLPQQKALYYSAYIDEDDAWRNDLFQKFLQTGKDLGEKMENAFKSGFNAGYESICIIGTDCLDLTGKIITEAFRQLSTHDVVIGPALDGGYYLLGMKSLHETFFSNKNWSSDTVLTHTLRDSQELGLTVFQLKPLSDIDRVDDLPPEFK